MKKYSYLIIIVLISGLVLTGCSLLSNISQVPATDQSGIAYLTKHTEGDPQKIDLLAGQTLNVGEVKVWNDTEKLYVQYVVDGPWEMTGSHLYVGKADPTNFPSTPGQLPYSPGMEKSPSLNALYNDVTMTYIIPLDEIYDYVFVGKGQGKGLNAVESTEGVGAEDQIFIAAHASLLDLDNLEIVDTVVDTVDVYANEPTPICSNVTLEIGKRYLLKASGTAFAGDTIDFDAKYSITRRVLGDDWSDLVTAYEGSGPGLLELKVDGDFVDWGLYNDAHVYYWDMYGKDFCVPLLIYDTYYPNNEGFLTVEIYLYQEESAWAIGDNNFGTNWATYFTYKVQQLPEYGLVLWLDAGEGITEPVDGAPVLKWEDQSEIGNDAEQSTESFQPTYVESVSELNGNPVVRFTGGEKYLRHSPILSSDYTAFYVLKLTESGVKAVYYYHAGAVYSGHLGFFAECKSISDGWGSVSHHPADNHFRTSDEYPTKVDWRIHTHQPNALYKNGNVVNHIEVDDVYADVGGITDVGSRSDNPNLYFVGDIAEILVYDRILTDSERIMVEDYLNAKYEIYP